MVVHILLFSFLYSISSYFLIVKAFHMSVMVRQFYKIKVSLTHYFLLSFVSQAKYTIQIVYKKNNSIKSLVNNLRKESVIILKYLSTLFWKALHQVVLKFINKSVT